MTGGSPSELLVLHAVRICGFADTPEIARRFELDPAETEELLLDAEAHGWVSRAAFADLHGWSLTESGRAENERLLAAELESAAEADRVFEVYRDFLPLNTRLRRACTDWQLRPGPGQRLTANDHSDPGWDAGVLVELAAIDLALGPLVDRLGDALTRFRGYDTRFGAALRRVERGDVGWIDGTDIDSCHRVWFEFHEDLVATLGLQR